MNSSIARTANRRSPLPYNSGNKFRHSGELITSSQESLNYQSGREFRDNSPCTDDGKEISSKSASRLSVSPHQENNMNRENNNVSESETQQRGDRLSVNNEESVSLKSVDTSGEKNDERYSHSSSSSRSDHRQSRERSFERSLDNILDKCSEKPGDLSLAVDKGTDGITCKGSDDTISSPTGKPKKKKMPWYSVLQPTYKSKSEDFKKLFKEIPPDERLVVDYSCALQKEILHHGRMFISQNFVCFYAHIFTWQTVLTIPFKDIVAITKERTARVIPNAIQISTDKEKYFFTTFAARDKTHMMLVQIWQNAKSEQPMDSKDFWKLVHFCYGDELGLTSSDDDYAWPDHEEPKDKKEHTDSSDIQLSENQQVQSVDTDAMVTDAVYGNDVSGVLPSGIGTSEIPTDFGDTTEDDNEREVTCGDHAHMAKTYMNDIFNIPVDKIFEFLFTDSPFFRHLCSLRKTYELGLPPWGDEVDEKGNRVRNISYTLTLGASFGPKTSPSTEKQIWYKESKPKSNYVLDCICHNGGIPYSDSFYVVNRYCINKINKNKSRILVTSEVKYKKSVWGLVKNLIEKNAVHGLKEYFQLLGSNLRNEADKLEAGGHYAKRKLRKRRSKHVLADSGGVSQPADTKSTSPSTANLAQQTSVHEEMSLKYNTEIFIVVIIIILLLLGLFNALMFYKLWWIESYTDIMYARSEEITRPVRVDSVGESEWSEILKQQQLQHDAELQRWKDILNTSVTMLDKMKLTLKQMHDNIDNRLQNQRHGV